MKKSLPLIVFLLLVTFSFAQTTQTGYVKTKGRLDSKGNLIPGARISGVAIQLTGGHSTVADANGDFTLTAPDKKFYLSDVQKQGYVLTDPDMLKKQYVCTANPLVISMETPSQQQDEKLAAERKLRRTLQQQLQKREQEMDSLREQNRITEEEYRAALQQIYDEQDNSSRLVKAMAERYVSIDFDNLDEFNRRISDCILNGRLQEADSLIASKGSIQSRVNQLDQQLAANAQVREALEKSEALARITRDELAADCYHKSEIFQLQNQRDSAAHYLEIRARLDSTNVLWQLDAGEYLFQYMARLDQAMTYYERAMRLALSDEVGEKSLAIKCYNHIGHLDFDKGEYDTALHYFQNALTLTASVYGDHHPEIALCYNNIGSVNSVLGSYATAEEFYQNSLDIMKSNYGETHAEVANVYHNLGSLHSQQGDYESALKNHEKALEIRKALFGDEHPDLSNSYLALGMLFYNYKWST